MVAAAAGCGGPDDADEAVEGEAGEEVEEQPAPAGWDRSRVAVGWWGQGERVRSAWARSDWHKLNQTGADLHRTVTKLHGNASVASGLACAFG